MRELFIYTATAAVIAWAGPASAFVNPHIHHRQLARFPNNCFKCVTCHCWVFTPVVLPT